VKRLITLAVQLIGVIYFLKVEKPAFSANSWVPPGKMWDGGPGWGPKQRQPAPHAWSFGAFRQWYCFRWKPATVSDPNYISGCLIWGEGEAARRQVLIIQVTAGVKI